LAGFYWLASVATGIKGACAMTFIKSYLNGEYGLRNSFWFGLVIGGTITSRLAYMLQPVVWRLYDAERIFSAIILQFIIVGLFIFVMGLAVGVLFAAFHQRQAGFWGWLSCAISGFVILGGLISIIEATTSIRTDGKSYGWPFGRDYRQFAHRGDFAFYVDRLLEGGTVTSLSFEIVTNLGTRTDPELVLPPKGDVSRLTTDTKIMQQICRQATFATHHALSHATITITTTDTPPRTLTLAPEDCETSRR